MILSNVGWSKATCIFKHGGRLQTSFNLQCGLLRQFCSGAPGYIFYFLNTSSRQFPSLSALTEVESVADFGVKLLCKNSQRRPESKLYADPCEFYSSVETTKYTKSPRNVRIQTEMTTVAMDIISKTIGGRTSASFLILDLGCGCGMHYANSTFKGLAVIGVDISISMLTKARTTHIVGSMYDFIQADVKTLQCMKMEMCDAALSISVMQWFFQERDYFQTNSSLHDFILSIAHCLKPGAPAVCQFYPRNIHDLQHTVNVVNHLDLFHGAIICTFPHGDKAKKLFLLLQKK